MITRIVIILHVTLFFLLCHTVVTQDDSAVAPELAERLPLLSSDSAGMKRY